MRVRLFNRYALAFSQIFLASLINQGHAFQFDDSVPQAIQSQLKQDLEFINGITGKDQSDLHKEIFGEVSGSAYQHFFNERIENIGMNQCGDSRAVACVIPIYQSSKMWLTDNYSKFDHPQIARLMIVYHEARHTEAKQRNWPHASCPKPFLNPDGTPLKSIWTGSPLAGAPACDVTPLGSYGSSLVLLKNISKYCTNCNDKVKLDAGIYADDQLKRITGTKARDQIVNDLYKSTL